MLLKRIIPCLDVADGKVVKGVNFENLREAGSVVDLAKQYSEDADELVLLDITATVEARSVFIKVVEDVAKAINIPFTVGGGISDVEKVKVLLDKGADKVSINSAAIRRPELINDIAQAFGSQCVVVAIDTKHINGEHVVHINGGRIATEIKTLEWVRRVEGLGAGELLVTSMDHDGVKQGFSLDLLKSIAAITTLPVIASGGAGAPEHFAELFGGDYADAGLAASIFHFGEIPIRDLKNYLHREGVPVRL